MIEVSCREQSRSEQIDKLHLYEQNKSHIYSSILLITWFTVWRFYFRVVKQGY